MLRLLPLFVLLISLLTQVSRAQAPPVEVDPTMVRLRTQLLQARADSSRAQLAFQISEQIYGADSIIRYAQLTLTLLARALPAAPPQARAALERLRGAALNNLSVGYSGKGDNQAAFRYLKQSLVIRRRAHDQQGLTEGLFNLAQSYDAAGDVPNAITYYRQSLRAALALSDTSAKRLYVEGQSLLKLVSIYQDLGDTAVAARYQQEAFLVLQRAGDPPNLVHALCLLAQQSMRAGRLTEAEAYAHRADSVATTAHLSYERRLIAEAMGGIRRRQGRLDEARTYLLTALRISEELQLPSEVLIALTHLTEVELQSGQLRPALTYATRGLELARQASMLSWVAEIEGLLATIYSRTGNYQQALLHHQAFAVAREKLSNQRARRAAIVQNVQYDFDKKAAAMRATQDKQAAITSAEIERQQLLLYAFAGGAILLILLSLLLWQRFRFARRAAAVIQQEKDRSEEQRQRAEYQRNRSDELLLNILPAEVAEELKETGKTTARQHEQVTVLFSDIVDFTQLGEQLTAQELVATLDTYFAAFDAITTRFGLEKIKTIGDAYMLAGGLGVGTDAAPATVVRAALAMHAAAETFRQQRAPQGLPCFSMRIGLHTGPVVAGVVGVKKFAYDIWGDTVNTAARMEQCSATGKVNLSETTYELVKQEFVCTPRGKQAVKHKGEIAMYFVDSERVVERAGV